MSGTAPRTGYLPALDGVRAIAVLMVVFHHAWGKREPVGALDTAIHTIAETGWMGVDLFFVLSGFLITRILLRHRDAPNLLKAFWWRRVLRILPLYYAYLGLSFVVFPAFGIHRFHPGPRAMGFYSTFLQNVWIAREGMGIRQPVHLWSVAVEEQFYLLWPFVVLLARGPWLLRVVLALLVATPMMRGGSHLVGIDWLGAYVLTPLRLDGLAWGALLALLATHPGGLNRWRRTAGWTGFAALTVTLVWVFGGEGMRPDLTTWWLRALLYTTTGLGFASLLVRVITADPDGPLVRQLTHPALRAIGRWSYAIYVLHPMVMVFARQTRLYPSTALQGTAVYLPSMVLYTVVCTAISIGLSALSWRFLESRFLALKPRVPYAQPTHET